MKLRVIQVVDSSLDSQDEDPNSVCYYLHDIWVWHHSTIFDDCDGRWAGSGTFKVSFGSRKMAARLHGARSRTGFEGGLL